MSGVEIVVLGGDSGRGESIIIISEEAILVVDSFIDKKSSLPAPISYLNSKGKDLNLVKYVIASHWHDDHIRGLDTVIDLCPNSQFVLSAALTAEEFKTLVYSESTKPLATNALNTFRNILQKSKAEAPKLASADKSIWRDSTGTIEVWSLSPSDKTIWDSIQDLKSLISEYKELTVSINSEAGNHFSIVLLVKAVDTVILLGGDLEVTDDPAKGWEAISTLTRINQIASINFYKVAHHGSVTGYCRAIWRKISNLSKCAITAYAPSELPRTEMIQEFQLATNNIFQTYCINKRTPARITNRTAEKIVTRTTGIKFFRSDRSFNGIAFDSSTGQVDLINDSIASNECL